MLDDGLRISTTHRRAAKSACALAVASVLLGAPLALAPASPAAAQARPSNLADLVDQVADAVVNISATQTVEDKDVAPDLAEGHAFRRDVRGVLQESRHQPAAARPHARNPWAPASSSIQAASSSPTITWSGTPTTSSSSSPMAANSRPRSSARTQRWMSRCLKVESDKPLKTVKFGDSDKMRVGDGVMAVGNPFGLGETVTAGIISARNRNIDSGPYDDFLQTDASINKGNSGGPLFNLQGEVIGINTAILSPSGGSIGIGFATPSATVVPVIEQLKEFHETRRGWLGVRIQPVDDTIADSLNLGNGARRSGRGRGREGSGKARGPDGGRRDRQVRRQGGQGIARSSAPRRLDAGRQASRGRGHPQRQGSRPRR